MIRSYSESFALEIPGLSTFVADFQRLEEEYTPMGPPMSPLTRSYFQYFVLCDLPITSKPETMASCFCEYVDAIDSGGTEMEIVHQCLAAIRDSRMGVFLQTGTEPLTLREIGSQEDLRIHSTTGYLGEAGQLWFVRLLPPVRGRDHVVVTTPYRLFNASVQDWSSALARELLAYQRQGLNVVESRPHSDGRNLRPIYGSSVRSEPLVEVVLTQAQRRRVANWIPQLYPAVGPEQRGTRLVTIPLPEAKALLNVAAGVVLDRNGREHQYARGIWQALRQALPAERSEH